MKLKEGFIIIMGGGRRREGRRSKRDQGGKRELTSQGYLCCSGERQAAMFGGDPIHLCGLPSGLEATSLLEERGRRGRKEEEREREREREREQKERGKGRRRAWKERGEGLRGR